MRYFLIIAIAFFTSSCATLFLPSKQKITIKTPYKDAEVYVDNEKFGEGKKSTNKVVKGEVRDVTIVYGDEYVQRNEVLIPGQKRSAGYYVAQVCNVPFYFILYGLWFAIMDTKVDKSFSYPKVNSFNAPPQKLPKRTDDLKYVHLSNIRLDIEDAEKSILVHWGKLKGDLESSIAKALSETEKATKKREKKKAKRKKKGKEKEYLVEKSKDLKYEDVVFTDDLMKTLYDGGFIDTVNNVFSDNNNTLIIEGRITGIDMFKIAANKLESAYIYQTRTDLVWYIKNTYNEYLDSISDRAISENFGYNRNIMKKTVGNSIQQSFFNLLEKKEFSKYAKIETNFDPKLKRTKLKKPYKSKTVKSKIDAAEATVIVKTENGHGSGFAITTNGYIVTNYHVISGEGNSKPKEIKVIDSDGNELDCKVVKVNKFQDVALLKVNKSFSKAFYCSSKKKFRKMEDVYTIGAPKSVSLGQSISSGLISNERKVNNNNLIQLSMSINFGNSGGPIFDRKGNLHGVVVSKLVGNSTEGVAFAVPSYLLTKYLNLKY